ncbi:MAG TPA: TolC family protein [Cellvibrionaceae bacterium]|nr:TolC family protein [Cellvibrionaceae bacterium]
MKFLIVLSLSLLSTITFASDTVTTNNSSINNKPVNTVPIPDLIKEAQVFDWLAQDPAARRAQHLRASVEAEAGLTRTSPYEWTAGYTHQKRTYTGVDQRSNEWNLELERTVRLPGKYRADQRIADATLGKASAQYNLARRETAENLITQYLEWLETRGVLALLQQQQQAAETNANAVAKRVKSGDAAAMDERLAVADLADVRRKVSSAQTAANHAWSQLSARYPVTDTQAALPDPLPVPQDSHWWQERIMAASDELAIVQAEHASAKASADRTSQDRIPDPTLGVFTGREAYGNEQLVGVRISMPLPGQKRSLAHRQQLAEANLAQDNLELTQRELLGRARGAYNDAVGSFERWQLANTAAATMQENARLLSKAYSLGEQDLQTLLRGRQQAAAAGEEELQARTEALQSYFQLLLDAKLLWPQILFEGIKQ